MTFIGNSQSFLDNISARINELDHRLQILAPVVIENGYSRNHSLLGWQTKGRAGAIVGETTNWSALHINRREVQVSTSTHGVSVRIPYNQHEWEATEDTSSLENLVSLSLEESLREKLLELCLYGERAGDVVVRQGLLNLSEASKVAFDADAGTVQDLVEAVLEAKSKSILAGSSNADGFRLLLPLALERKLQQFYNTAGTLTGKEYLEDKYGFSLIVTEMVNKPVLLPASAQDAYFHRYADVKVSLKGVDPNSGSLTYFGSVAGAWLVLSQPKRIVYLEKA